MKIIGLLSIITSVLFSSAYRVPEHSFSAAALSSAYLANANRADGFQF